MYEITKLSPSQIEEQPVITIEQIYTKRIDFIDDNLLYKGQAIIGSLISNPVWRIVRITINNEGDVIEEYANGNGNFNQIWNDRLILDYI